MTLFGVIHSVEPAGGLYLPWDLAGVARTMAFQFTAAYVVLAAVIGILAALRGPAPERA
jgi:AGZA family xanthine/uracil permease-like MFS transporter